MGTDRPAIDKIFCAATEINGPEDRKAFVQRAAGGDQDLIAQVHRLLDAHCDVGSFLDQAAPELDATTD